MNPDQKNREIVLPAATLAVLSRAVEEQAGAPAAVAALRAAGREASTQVLEELSIADAGPGQISEADFWRRLSSYFERRGWGGLELDTSHPGVGLLDGSAWADADGSSYSEGLLAGVLAGVTGAEIEVLRLPGAGREGGSTRFAFGSAITIRTLRARLAAASDVAAALQAL